MSTPPGWSSAPHSALSCALGRYLNGRTSAALTEGERHTASDASLPVHAFSRKSPKPHSGNQEKSNTPSPESRTNDLWSSGNPRGETVWILGCLYPKSGAPRADLDEASGRLWPLSSSSTRKVLMVISLTPEEPEPNGGNGSVATGSSGRGGADCFAERSSTHTISWSTPELDQRSSSRRRAVRELWHCKPRRIECQIRRNGDVGNPGMSVVDKLCKGRRVVLSVGGDSECNVFANPGEVCEARRRTGDVRLVEAVSSDPPLCPSQVVSELTANVRRKPCVECEPSHSDQGPSLDRRALWMAAEHSGEILQRRGTRLTATATELAAISQEGKATSRTCAVLSKQSELPKPPEPVMLVACC
eukprot:848758-Rhodomonas_salina.1